jgi:hypothetical protein
MLDSAGNVGTNTLAYFAGMSDKGKILHNNDYRFQSDG